MGSKYATIIGELRRAALTGELNPEAIKEIKAELARVKGLHLEAAKIGDRINAFELGARIMSLRTSLKKPK
ncbi:MAG: hypothetical protein ABIA76_03775 [Candidatus Diapherotrites archaeon]